MIIRKTIGWLVTPPYLLVFLATVLIWHPLIVGSYYFGQNIYRWIITLGNGALLLGLRLCGTRFSISGFKDLPRDRPLIVVSNHQSLYDIPLLVWHLRSARPGFIAKKELGHGWPSASHALRHMGSALIDRSDSKSAITTIEQFGQMMQARNSAAVIFPEGTRARDGRMRPFKTQGVRALLRTMPDALVVPVVISGSWKLVRWSLCPIYPGARITARVLPLLEAKPLMLEGGIRSIEALIRAALPPEESHSPVEHRTISSEPPALDSTPEKR